MEYNTYLSDDENDIEEEQTVELDQYGMPIENDDEDEEEQLEIRRIISDKLLSGGLDEDYYINENESPKKKLVNESKTQHKKSMSLNDLNNFIDKEIESKKPKKFVSKRSMEKKSSEPILSAMNNVKEIKRQFNPRLIPYLFSEEYKNKKMFSNSKAPSFDNLEFPSL